MRLIRDSRGAIAVLSALLAVPLIALASLGGEVGMWYVVKRHAQNAADASALAGAMALLNSADVNGRVAVVAQANGFTNGSSPSPGTFQSVPQPVIDIANQKVTVNVSQTQPTLLASVVGLTSVTTVATATAQVKVNSTKPICMLGLNQNDSGAVTIGGNSSISGGSCSIMSDGGIKLNSPPTLPAGGQLFSAHGCKSPACAQIASPGGFTMPVASNPLARLDQPGAVPPGTGGSNPKCCTLNPGTYGTLNVRNGSNWTLNPGTYYFDSISMNGGSLNGTGVNIVVNSDLSITGGTINLTAGKDPVLDGVVIYDRGSSAVKITGGPGLTFTGAIYVPKADVTWAGNSTTNTGCSEIVAYSLTITGTTTLDTSSCAQYGNIVPKVQVVLLTS